MEASQLAYPTLLFQCFETVESDMQRIDGGIPTLKADIIMSPGDGVWVTFHEPRSRTVNGTV